MKILKKDLKEGIIRLLPNTPEDLWHLEHIISPGDLVSARTLRSTSIKRGQEIEQAEKKPVTLTIQVESKEFHRYTGKLRLKGKITAGPDDISLSSYHTLQLEPGNPVSIKKEWKKVHLDRLKKAGTSRPLLFVCTLDRDSATFAEIRESGVEWLGEIRYKKFKGKEDDREPYYEEISKTLSSQKTSLIIIAGPGFEKENLLKRLKNSNPDLASKISLEYVSYAGQSGVSELLRKSGNKLLKKNRIAEETQAVQDFLQEIENESGLSVYGEEKTQKAVEMGAVKTLLVSEANLSDFEAIMNIAEKTGAKISIIAVDHEAGERLQSLGGIAAILRFKIE